ncbi:Cwf21 domain-containing protein [Aphelenchoides fujianensis]|nr:Cwf21 domain-containing protein [Aphelenchoides fujianensis]KAI6238413.1 Cwf21 domain-containing protein [Aphelenchoides fujianensis]
MYNGVGVQTARGTGTSGYVQSNVSALSYSKHRKAYNAEEDIARAEAVIERKPNAELLDHEYKRRIEIKCVELEDLMESEGGKTQEEIDETVSEYRQLLFSEFESGRLNLDDELDIRNSHSRMKVAKDNRDRMRNALGISNEYVAGTVFTSMKKPTDPDAPQVEEDPEIALKKRLIEELRKEKEKKKEKKAEQRKLEKRAASASSSSSSSSSSDSSEDSDESPDSSTDEDEKKKRKKKASKRKSSKKDSSSKSKKKKSRR